MDRNREVRRGSMAASANGLTKRRHRSSSLRDSPEDDGQLELQETTRLRDRGVKKDRDRDRERDRDRDRDRERSSRTKRRRGDRLMHGNNREDGIEDSSEESVNDEDEDDEDEGGGGGAMRMLPPNPVALVSSSLSNHHHQHRKSFSPSMTAKTFRSVRPADEMIAFSVPRKARSATKRSHECWVSGSGAGGEQIHPQASTSPVRPTLPSTSTPSPAPISPSSSNASGRKKMKPNGPKQRPPKSSSKSSSSNPEELEIEIAEVLYGLMTQSQSQGPSTKKEIPANDSAKFDSREVNKLSSDAKSRVSSPISNSTSTAPQSAAVLPQNSSSSATPLAVVAPKRKRPRQVSENLGNFSGRNISISSTTTQTMKVEIDQLLKTEISSPNLDKNTGSAAENGSALHDFAGSQAGPPPSEPPPSESGREEPGNAFTDSKPAIEESRESRDVDRPKEEAATSPKKESTVVRPEDDREDATASKANSTASGIETHREEKFQIDLMAPPPPLRFSPEREADIDHVAAAEHKPAVPHSDAEMRPMVKDKEEENAVKSGSGKDEAVNVVEPELKKAKATVEGESEKPVVRNIDLQLDLEKPERDSDTGTGNGNKLNPHVQKQQQQLPKAVKDEPKHTEKTVQTSSLPLPMSVASWPGGLPPMGYMAPLQGVVSMDGSPVPSTPMQPLFSQPRPKRCATHCYIARSIHYLQQLMKMSPFWSAAAGSASIYGAKPCNLNVVPPAELHGNIAGRSVNPVQDKSQGLAIFPGHSGKDKGSQAANIADAQRKQQILLQQALPPGAPPSNILHGPTFIFPLNQPQAAAAASVRPGSVKSPTVAGTGASTSASNSASVNGSATAAPVGFNYPNLPASETQYLAILQNNAYTFPLPGAPPNYRGTHAQPMPYFNGSFYSSQMIHPSQIQQQQQPSSQPLQMQQSHQNTSISSGSSSSQKHIQSQQQRPQSTNSNGGNGSGNLHSFPAQKIRPSQQRPSQHMSLSHQTRQPESEVGGEDSPSTADSRVSRAKMNVYGQNFTLPIHHQNFALMTPHSAVAGASGGGSQGEKKQQQQTHQGMKAGVESLAPQTFAMSFAPINGSTAPSIDISSMAHGHAVFQSSPEARHNYQQIMAATAAAQAAQQKKNFRVSEEGKTGGGDSSSMDEEKKGLVVKASVTVGQSIAFSGPELADPSVPGSNVIDSSNRTLNLVSAPPRTSRSSMGTVNPPNSQLQAQLQYQQQQQMMQMQMQKHQHQQLQQQQQQQQQQQLAAAAARNKTPATSNGSAYGDHLTSSSSAATAAKFPSALSAFPQNLVQSSSSSPSQSPQWKNSARTTQQVPASLASSTTSLKNLSQQQARTQQTQTQISFGGSQKSTAPQGHQAPTSHQSPPPPMVVGSPTTSSISKGASGSPRTITSASQGNKPTQPSALSSQQSKNSASGPSQKSSPVGGRNVSSILGNPHIASSTTGTKPQMMQQQQQQQQQHQLQKQAVQQPQLFFTPAYLPPQNPHSTGASSTASVTSGYYLHSRRRPEQQQQPQQPQVSSASSSTGMLSLCPVTLASASTTDAKAAAAAASNMKGGGLPSQSILHPAQFTSQSTGNSHQLVPGFSYVHAIPAAVQVKPTEQKQPAGNHHCLTRK